MLDAVKEARLWTLASRLKSPRIEEHFNEGGDTLIEVLIALLVVGLTAVVLITAFTTSITASAEHYNLAGNDAVLRNAADQAFSEIQQTPNPLLLYSPCATSYSSSDNFGVPSTYVLPPVITVKLWSDSSETFVPSVGSGCSGWTTAQQTTPQLITITVTPKFNSTPSTSTQFVVDSRGYVVAG
jgi:type II secretory pathway pseudopilin PulG